MCLKFLSVPYYIDQIDILKKPIVHIHARHALVHKRSNAKGMSSGIFFSSSNMKSPSTFVKVNPF